MPIAPRWIVLIFFASLSPAHAQQPNACRWLCSPQFLVEPTLTIENIAGRHRTTTSSREERVARREAVVELIFATDIDTRLPRLGLTAEAIVPQGDAIELELEANIAVLESEQTRGWVSSHVDIVDKFSPAELPGPEGSYSHKVNFEWDTAFAVFKWLPAEHWLRTIEVEGSLDYVASGLPKRGDIIDAELFLDDASPWSFSIVLVIPVAPR